MQGIVKYPIPDMLLSYEGKSMPMFTSIFQMAVIPTIWHLPLILRNLSLMAMFN